jgi:hypothetical protein
MAGDNPFDLTKLITNGGLIEKHKYKPEVFTTEEQKEMLKGFELVPRNKWAALEVGTHIRYLRKDGEMRKGGYIRYVDPNGEFLSVSLTELNQQSKSWKLPLSGVAQIWRESNSTDLPATSHGKTIAPNSSSANLRTQVNSDVMEAIAAIKEDIRQLKIEIQRVMNQQKRIIKSVGINAVRLDRIEGSGRL